jgi:hypothetical protein
VPATGVLPSRRGRPEAASAIGLGRGQTLRLVLLPQAVPHHAAVADSQLVVLLKDTSLGFVISYLELLRSAQRVVQVLDNPLQLFTLVALVYIVDQHVAVLPRDGGRAAAARARWGSRGARRAATWGRAPEPGPRRRRADGGRQVRPRHRARPRGGGEVVNADSMQLYRGMDVGTAKLAPGRARAACRTTCSTSGR